MGTAPTVLGISAAVSGKVVVLASATGWRDRVKEDVEMRQVRAVAAATLLLGVAMPMTAAADTGPARSDFEFDRVTADFAFSEGGRDFVGQVLVQRDSASGEATTSFFFYSSLIVDCDNGTPNDPSDDFEGQDLIDFTAAETSPTTLQIDQKLRDAAASGVGTGERRTIEPCSGAETVTTETVSWSFAVTATGPTQHSTQVERFPNDDGTVTLQTIKTADRPAAGTIDVGDKSLVAEPASIMHVLIVEATH